jgi:hypothetical protein
LPSLAKKNRGDWLAQQIRIAGASLLPIAELNGKKRLVDSQAISVGDKSSIDR